MGYIILRKITFSQAVNAPQSLTVKIKKQSDPDSAYAIAGTNIAAAINGTLTAPLVINNVEDLTAYTLLIYNNCGGIPFQIPVTTSATGSGSSTVTDPPVTPPVTPPANPCAVPTLTVAQNNGTITATWGQLASGIQYARLIWGYSQFMDKDAVVTGLTTKSFVLPQDGKKVFIQLEISCDKVSNPAQPHYSYTEEKNIIMPNLVIE